METKSQTPRLEALKQTLCFDHMFVINSVGLSGGLALLWKKNIEVEIPSHCHNWIHTSVHSKEEGHSWFNTFFYGNPDFSLRRH